MAALEQLYRRYYRLVRWALRAGGVTESALDDRVHDVFLAIHRRLPQRDPEVPMRQWVVGVARNVAFSHRRGAARRQRQLELLDAPRDPPQPDEQLARRRAWHALSSFLEQLPPEQREVFVMVDITGMRVSELATMTGEPANTLHSRLRVARVRFGRHFEASDDARPAMLRHAARRAGPDQGQRGRTWAGIVAAVGGPEGLASAPGSAMEGAGSSSAAASWLSSTAGKVALTTLAAGVVAAAVVGGARLRSPTISATEKSTDASSAVARADGDPKPRPPAEPGPAEAEAMVATASAPATTETSSPRASRVAAPPSSRRAPNTPNSASPNSASPNFASPNSASPNSASPNSASPNSASPNSASPNSASPPGDPDAAMAAATATLRRAREHLAQGRSADALAELEASDGDFGALERERLRLRLEASCTLADSSRAQTIARALVARGVALNPDAPCLATSDEPVD